MLLAQLIISLRLQRYLNLVVARDQRDLTQYYNFLFFIELQGPKFFSQKSIHT